MNAALGRVECSEEALARFLVVELRVKGVSMHQLGVGGLVEAPIEWFTSLAETDELSGLLGLSREAAERSLERLRWRHDVDPFRPTLCGSRAPRGEDSGYRYAATTKTANGARREHVDELDLQRAKLLFERRVGNDRSRWKTLLEYGVVNESVPVLLVDVEVDELEALVDERTERSNRRHGWRWRIIRKRQGQLRVDQDDGATARNLEEPVSH